MRNTIFIKITLVVISLITAAPAQANSNRLCPAQLQREVEKVAQSPKLKAARVGVFVQTNSPSPQVLANLDGDRYFIPASNAKLFVTAIALKALGPNYQFATRLMSHDLPNANGELENGLWLIGSGDPSFNSKTGLKSLVNQLKRKGVKRINGGIWSLTSRRGAEVSGSWEWSDLQHYYAAIASPFTINENSLYWTVSTDEVGKPPIFTWDNPEWAKDWRIQNQAITASADSPYSLKVERPYGQNLLIITGQIPEKSKPRLGGVAIPDPEANFLDLLRQELTVQGIEISSDITASKKLPPTKDLAINLSPPISQLIIITNKDSNNLYAELLLRALGDRLQGISPDDSVKGGMLAISQYLQSVNIPSAQVSLADGSGLSRHSLTTPKAIVQLLQTVASDRNFRQSLAIANVDGTLTNRFKNTSAQSLLQAKTGTLSGAIVLSGYASPQNYREVVFSIIINNSNLTPRELQKYVDEIALLLTRLEPCE